MKIKLLAIAAAALVLYGCNQAPEEPAVVADPINYADKVLINGKILTVDENFSVVEALAIEGERISAVGDNTTVSALIGDSTEVIDLQGRTVIPGLIDNHLHFIRAGQRWNLQARIDGVNNRQEALDIIADKAASMDPGDWFMVQGGWWPGQFADQPGGFSLEELDSVAPDNPMFLQLVYFTVYANSLALQAVGVDPSEGAEHGGPVLISPQPPYGALNEQMPEVDREQIKQNVRDVIAELNRTGLTSVYDVGRPPEGDITLLDEMSQEGNLNMRVWHTLKYEAYNEEDADEAIALIKSSEPGNGDYLGLLGVGEHVYLPFFDLPGFEDVYSDEIVAEFGRISRAAAEQGLRINEHTMMDQTINSALDAWEVINEDIPLAPLRWSLEHLFNPSVETLQRMKDLGITATVHSVAQTLPPALQPPMRTIQDMGLIWGLGSDGTIVTPYQPFLTLGWAVTGRTVNGQQLHDQTVTREEALIAHTRSNAYLLFKEDDLGSLEVGKFADLVVLNKDYMTVPEDEIFYIESELTMVGGEVVYEAEEDAAAQAGPGAPPQMPVSDSVPDRIAIYKSVDGVDLQVHIFNAKGVMDGEKSPALVFMHGGGLRRGSPEQGYEFADNFTQEGVAVVAVQYRLLDNNAETLDQLIADAKSAVRWLRENAEDLSIDPDRIVMAGHSAGAFLSLTTGVLPKFEEHSENLQVSSVPNALIPWSAMVSRADDPENSMLPEGLQMDDLSPASYVRPGLPPAMFIHGDMDPVAPYEVAQSFEQRYRAAGNNSSFHVVEGADHFFAEPEQRAQVMELISQFLAELGYSKT